MKRGRAMSGGAFTVGGSGAAAVVAVSAEQLIEAARSGQTKGTLPKLAKADIRHLEIVLKDTNSSRFWPYFNTHLNEKEFEGMGWFDRTTVSEADLLGSTQWLKDTDVVSTQVCPVFKSFAQLMLVAPPTLCLAV